LSECRPEISRGAELDSWGRVERFLTKKKEIKKNKIDYFNKIDINLNNWMEVSLVFKVII
jgi:hypothetical protein